MSSDSQTLAQILAGVNTLLARSAPPTPPVPPVPPLPPVPPTPPVTPNAVMLGMNIGNDQNATNPNNAPYAKVQNTADLAFLKPFLTRLRIALTYGQDANDLANLKQLAIDAKAAGFYVSFGITAGAEPTAAAYYNKWLSTDVLATAKWAQANKMDEFMIGNEEDWNAQNSGAFSPKTPTQIRNDVRGLVASIRPVFSGKIVYCTAEGTLAGWVAEGIGNLDMIYFNVYDTLQNFASLVKTISNNFWPKAGISEWAAQHPYPNGMTDVQYAAEIAARGAILKASGMPYYLYTWRDGGDEWAFKLEDGTTRPGLSQLLT